MRAHFITGVIASALAVGIAVPLSHRTAPEPVKIVQTEGKYGWGSLTPAEQKAAADLIGKLDHQEVQIFCVTPGCQDLGEDIDEVFDLTGAASNLQRSMLDLGAGMGISPANDQTKKIAAAFKTVTNGRVDLQVIDEPQKGGGIVIALGRKPRH